MGMINFLFLSPILKVYPTDYLYKNLIIESILCGPDPMRINVSGLSK